MSLNELSPLADEVWHPYWSWEEFHANMWGEVSRRPTWLKIAITFTADAELYGEWMMAVVDQWPKSCEHNLTKSGDKRAWIGHAAVAMAIKCPEDIVRQAWAYLTEQQQIAANGKASKAIEYWRGKYAKA